MMDEYRQTLSMQETENGALGYSTTGKDLVDLNFTVPSNHNNVSSEDIEKMLRSLDGDPVLTVKWLFYLRDVREGLGERDSFVKLFLNLPEDIAVKVLPLIPEYGRWKDVIDILVLLDDESVVSKAAYNLVVDQLAKDLIRYDNKESISLLAKWMPSVNASKKSRRIALKLCKKMVIIPMEYRKILSALRQYLDVTEVKTCGGEWDKVDYNKVSSNANLRYVKAFMKHDPDRRQKYLDELARPIPIGAVMHASNLYPHEVYAKYNIKGRVRILDPDCGYGHEPAVADPGIEAMWNNLKSIPTMGNTMVVCDGSGSMEHKINGSGIMAIDVSRALGIFFSEKCTGEFKDKVIEFSADPQFIDLSGCKTLADKYNTMCKYTDCSNTNLEKVFDLLLVTAVRHNIPQKELPQRILIVSDMEFDNACEFCVCRYGFNHNEVMSRYMTLFETIKNRWDMAGYKMPEIVFWNINSRTKTIPVQANEAGVNLVSGFSVNNTKMVLAGKADPWSALKDVLESNRYQAVGDALQNEAE